jgi:hypothetical protein
MTEAEQSKQPSELRQFADEVLACAERFPWKPFPKDAADPEAEGQPRPFLWFRYHYACLVAGRRLFRAFLLLHDASLEFEASLPLRSLLELSTIQRSLALDEGGVFDLLAEAAVSRETMSSDIAQIASRGELEWDAAAQGERHERYRRSIESFVAQFPKGGMPWPFEKTPKQRLTEAGLEEWYEIVYRRASNLAHMNAAVLESYVSWTPAPGFVLPSLDQAAGFTLDRAVWLVVRMLRVGDACLRQDQAGKLDGLYERWRSVSPSAADHDEEFGAK